MSKRAKQFDHVEIIDIGAKGKAIGKKPDGEIVLVDQVVPGDVVDVVTTRRKKGIWNGTPIRWLKKSPYRVDAFCSHFGVCGGCKWQHLRYEKQLFFKQKAIHDNLVRIGGFKNPEIHAILPPDLQINYRNKMEFSCSDRRWLMKEEMGNENIDISFVGMCLAKAIGGWGQSPFGPSSNFDAGQ